LSECDDVRGIAWKRPINASNFYASETVHPIIQPKTKKNLGRGAVNDVE